VYSKSRRDLGTLFFCVSSRCDPFVEVSTYHHACSGFLLVSISQLFPCNRLALLRWRQCCGFECCKHFQRPRISMTRDQRARWAQPGCLYHAHLRAQHRWQPLLVVKAGAVFDINICACVFVCTYVCMLLRINVCMYACMFSCLYVRLLHTYVMLCMYTYIFLSVYNHTDLVRSYVWMWPVPMLQRSLARMRGTCIHVCVCGCVRVCLWVCVCVRVRACVCVWKPHSGGERWVFFVGARFQLVPRKQLWRAGVVSRR